MEMGRCKLCGGATLRDEDICILCKNLEKEADKLRKHQEEEANKLRKQSEIPEKTKKWEYWFMRCSSSDNPKKVIEKLDILGEDGWELVGILTPVGVGSLTWSATYYFKREKRI